MEQSRNEPQAIRHDPWEEMKPQIEQLWLIEKLKLPLVVGRMKANHGFDAV
jgi:hypothetical protein